VGLTGDDLLHRLVGKEGSHGQEGSHHGDGKRRVPAIVRPAVAIGRRGDTVAPLEALV
jgi:hypothetical protein